MSHRLLHSLLILTMLPAATYCRADERGLSISWEKNYLTIRGEFPGDEIKVLYLEAYCRPGSTNRDWGQTVIKHKAELVSASADGKRIELRDTLDDGVIVRHVITAGRDEVDFRLEAHNPTQTPSLAHWAQPCIRVGGFTSCPTDDARTLVPQYARQCFLFIDDELSMLPTKPWAEKARYIPGQVYVPQGVPRTDVNPRPMSELVPSHGLTGCFSADRKMIMASCWEPYQEVFLGVITCIHNDFRIGGLAPREKKTIRGKIYILSADVDELRRRHARDFPEQSNSIE